MKKMFLGILLGLIILGSQANAGNIGVRYAVASPLGFGVPSAYIDIEKITLIGSYGNISWGTGSSQITGMNLSFGGTFWLTKFNNIDIGINGSYNITNTKSGSIESKLNSISIGLDSRTKLTDNINIGAVLGLFNHINVDGNKDSLLGIGAITSMVYVSFDLFGTSNQNTATPLSPITPAPVPTPTTTE